MVKVSIAVLACAASGTFVNAYQPQFDFPWMQNLQADPAERAAALVKEMNLTEKVHMLHGSGEGYVGNVEANTRLNIPAIKMNDGPQGFRGIPGTSTAFPSGLNAAATWDGDLVELWGKTMGEEFFDKGANVQLGPGMCVARVPHNGRNFEYLSGEDPFLGYKLVPRAIKGIQDQGVIANAKHYVNNNQETDRTTVSENVDERTQFEFYYPPFRGAVEAGVGSVMCSVRWYQSLPIAILLVFLHLKLPCCLCCDGSTTKFEKLGLVKTPKHCSVISRTAWVSRDGS